MAGAPVSYVPGQRERVVMIDGAESGLPSRPFHGRAKRADDNVDVGPARRRIQRVIIDHVLLNGFHDVVRQHIVGQASSANRDDPPEAGRGDGRFHDVPADESGRTGDQ